MNSILLNSLRVQPNARNKVTRLLLYIWRFLQVGQGWRRRAKWPVKCTNTHKSLFPSHCIQFCLHIPDRIKLLWRSSLYMFKLLFMVYETIESVFEICSKNLTWFIMFSTRNIYESVRWINLRDIFKFFIFQTFLLYFD